MRSGPSADAFQPNDAQATAFAPSVPAPRSTLSQKPRRSKPLLPAPIKGMSTPGVSAHASTVALASSRAFCSALFGTVTAAAAGWGVCGMAASAADGDPKLPRTSNP